MTTYTDTATKTRLNPIKPQAHMDAAEQFADEEFLSDGRPSLIYTGTRFMSEDDKGLCEVEREAVRAQLYSWLDKQCRSDRYGNLRPVHPNKHMVDRIMAALKYVGYARNTQRNAALAAGGAR